METKISVLYVDDEPGLLELAKTYLEMEEDLEVTTCESPLKAFKLLEDGEFDVIVSDYQMPEMDGIQFLKKLQSFDEHWPFIIFTGRGREEVVIEAFNSGADFYIQKGGHAKSQFADLSKKIHYAFERRQAEITVIKQSRAMEASIDGIAILDPSFHHVYANQSFAEIFGWDSPLGLHGQPFEVLLEKGQVDISGLQSVPSSKSGGLFQGDVIGKKRDGAKVPIGMTLSKLDDGGVVVVARDITEMVEAERSIKEHSHGISIINDIIRYANQARDLGSLMHTTLKSTIRLMGYEAGGIYLLDPGRESATLRHHVNLPDDFRITVERVDKSIPLFEANFLQGEALIFDGASRGTMVPPGPFKTLAFIPLSSKQEIIGSLVVATRESDKVTGLEKDALISIGNEIGAAISRLQAEEDRERSRSNLQTLFDGLDEMLFIMDRDCNILETNLAVMGHLGYPPGSLEGMNMMALMPTDRRTEAQCSLKQILDGQKSICDIPLLSAEGDLLNAETNLSLASWNGRQVLVGVSRDVGPRLRMEEALHESEHFNRTLMENIPAYILLYDDSGRILYINPYSAKGIGYRKEEVIGSNILRFVADEYKQQTLDRFNRRICGREVPYYELEILRHDGGKRLVSVTGHRIAYKGVTSSLVVLNDITELRRTSEAWKRSDELYRLISTYTSDVIWMMDLEGRFTYVSPSVQTLRGFNPEEVMAQSLDDLSTPGSREEMVQAMQEGLKLIRKGEVPPPIRIEIEQPVKGGGAVWTEAVIQASLDDEGRPNGFIGVSRNIQDRRLAESRLRESEEHHRLLIENSHDIIYMLDKEGILTFVSPSWTVLLGHDVNDVQGKPFVPLIHPDDVPDCYRFIAKVISSGSWQDGIVYRVRHLNGEYRWHTSSWVPVRGKDGSIVGIEGIARDITDKKMAEQPIHDSEDKYRALFTDSPVSMMIFSTDLDEIVDANKAVLDFYGVKNIKELQSQPLWSEPPYSITEAMEWVERTMQDGVQSFEWMSRQKDGRESWVMVDLDIININGLDRLLVTSKDITDQKDFKDAL